jgi:hypothetical protein
VINISNHTSKDNPSFPTVQVALTTAEVTEYAGSRTIGARIRNILDRLAELPRRWGDLWFAMNDAEAGWRGWQATSMHGGLGRRYRDPRFDTVAECAQCQGFGFRADVPCAPCLGTGRVAIRGVS